MVLVTCPLSSRFEMRIGSDIDTDSAKSTFPPTPGYKRITSNSVKKVEVCKPYHLN